MALVDRYVVKRFFFFFFFASMASLAIYLVVDPIENLDKFIDKKVTTENIIRYYILYVPYIIYLTYPVSTLLATMFSIGGLTGSNELLAMTASGIPLRRHIFMLGFIALLMSGVAFWWGETLVPYTNKERLAIWRQEVKKRVDWRLLDQGQVYVQTAKNQILHLNLYSPKSQTGHGVNIYETEDNRIRTHILASSMSWNGEKWILHNVITRTFSDEKETVLKEPRREFIADLQPTDLIELKVEPEEMGLYELQDFVKRIKHTGGQPQRWIVDIHGKIALPFAGFIITLFGIPLSAIRRRSGLIFGITLSLLISFLYFGIMQIGKVLGYKEILDPWLSAWIGNIVFFILAIFFYQRAPR